MNKKPILVVMAAGMGSRYGGLKQMDPMDEYGHLIMDFSIYDAVRAGFEKVVFIIKRENLDIFRERIGFRLESHIQVEYVFQEMKLPEGFEVPQGRVKPFGTGHAVLCCKDVLDAPFVVINADDYYGPQGFAALYQFLTTHTDEPGRYHFAMAGYLVENTLSESGGVSRGVCSLRSVAGSVSGTEAGSAHMSPAGTGNSETASDGVFYLDTITERTCIERRENGPAYSEDKGVTWTAIPAGSLVSMNLWAFSENLLPELETRFLRFLKEELPANPLKAEFFLPFAVNELLHEGKADVQVLRTEDVWYGVTYPQDKEQVVAAIRRMKAEGRYPERVWED